MATFSKISEGTTVMDDDNGDAVAAKKALRLTKP